MLASTTKEDWEAVKALPSWYTETQLPPGAVLSGGREEGREGRGGGREGGGTEQGR